MAISWVLPISQEAARASIARKLFVFDAYYLPLLPRLYSPPGFEVNLTDP